MGWCWPTNKGTHRQSGRAERGLSAPASHDDASRRGAALLEVDGPCLKVLTASLHMLSDVEVNQWFLRSSLYDAPIARRAAGVLVPQRAVGMQGGWAGGSKGFLISIYIYLEA